MGRVVISRSGFKSGQLAGKVSKSFRVVSSSFMYSLRAI